MDIRIINSAGLVSNKVLKEVDTLVTKTWPTRKPTPLWRLMSLVDIAIALDDGHAIGFGQLHTACKIGLTKCFIEDIVVAEAYRHQGIATRIVKSLMAIATESGADIIQITSAAELHAAHKLYENLGFARTGGILFRHSLRPPRLKD